MTYCSEVSDVSRKATAEQQKLFGQHERLKHPAVPENRSVKTLNHIAVGFTTLGTGRNAVLNGEKGKSNISPNAAQILLRSLTSN